MIKAAVLGATGYAGAELIRLLYNHPECEVVGVGSKSFEGQPLSDVYPSFKGFYDMPCQSNEDAIKDANVVFGT